MAGTIARKSTTSPMRLGKGLAALIGENEGEGAVIERARRYRRVAIEHILPNPNNPRRHFEDQDLQELANSIREKGIVQPIVVRNTGGENAEVFEIIAGERRWRAAKKVGCVDVPVTIFHATDREAFEIAIVENVQRANLNPIEEATGYERLILVFNYTQADVARATGKSRSHIANSIRLLKLPKTVIQALEEGNLTPGHGRAIITHEDPEALAARILAENLTVREAEILAQAPSEGPDQAEKSPEAHENTVCRFQDLASQIQDVLSLPVKVRSLAKGGGRLTVVFNSADELQNMISRLTGGGARRAETQYSSGKGSVTD